MVIISPDHRDKLADTVSTSGLVCSTPTRRQKDLQMPRKAWKSSSREEVQVFGNIHSQQQTLTAKGVLFQVLRGILIFINMLVCQITYELLKIEVLSTMAVIHKWDCSGHCS